ncbi:MAG: SDR family oxidoreductase [Bacteriovoracia bacterium]
MKNTFLITGANRGIGLELTRQALQSGATVLATARKINQANDLVFLKEKYPDNLEVLSVDVSTDSSVEKLSSELKERQVDILINNAGVFLEPNLPLTQLSLDKVLETININTLGAMRVCRALIKNLSKSPSPKVIQITSLMGSIADNESGGYYGYRMSKAALNMFNMSFSKDFPNITSIVVHPGWVQTDMGGSQAPVLPRDSAKGILAVAGKITKNDSGKFFDFEGDLLPW